MIRNIFLFWLLAAVSLAGCATVPAGPSVMVLPAPEKPFEQFQRDDASCRQWALQQVGVGPGDAVNDRLIRGAAVGTLIGTGAGVAIGAASGHAGAGAAIGAGTGLLAGTAMATDPAYATGMELQRRYDAAYQQCMYAKGNQIPLHRRDTRKTRPLPPPPPPPGYGKTIVCPPPPPKW